MLMLRHILHRRLFTALAAMAATPLLASDDFGIWSGVSVQKDFSKAFSVDASLGFRAEDCLKQASRWDISIGADYKPVKWFSFGASYTYIYGRKSQEDKAVYDMSDDDDAVLNFRGFNVDHGYWRSRHRVSIDVTGRVSLGRLGFSLRERYQYTHYQSTSTLRDRYRTEIPSTMVDGWTGDIFEYSGHYFSKYKQVTDEKPSKDKHLLRSRLTASYNIRHSPLTPYASAEMHNDLNDAWRLDKVRIMAGTEWKISKQHRIDLAYVFQHSNDDDDVRANLHALSVEYKFKF